MNIIYVVSGTGLLDGSTKSFLCFLKGVCEAGHNCLVICPDKEGLFKYLALNVIEGANPVYINYTYNILPFIKRPLDYILYIPRIIKKFLKNRIAAIRLIKISKEFKPYLIHSNTSVNNIGYLAAKVLHIPHIWHIREYGKLDFDLLVPFQHKLLKSSNNYIISITKDLAKYKSVDNNPRARVIYNGIISEKDFRYSDKHKEFFLYAGRVTKSKGIFELLEAYSIYVNNYNNKVIKLIIAGDLGKEKIQDEIERFCIEHKIEEYVQLIGAVDNIKDLMFCATATIVPSIKEGFGRVLPEAMANGSLTIGRNEGGLKEQFDNGLEITGTEIGYRYNNIEELATILDEVSKSDKSDYKEMIFRSQEVVRSLYLDKKNISNILSFYNEIIESK